MEKWCRPLITELGFQSTAGGDLGGNDDGVVYSITGKRGKVNSLIGTSGPASDVYLDFNVVGSKKK